MPYTRRHFGRFRRRYGGNRRRTHRVGAPLGRMPRWGRRQRVAQGLTRNVFWFKRTGPIEVLPNGTMSQRFSANQASLTSSFQNYARSYEQFKVLKVVLKLYPASVGSESISTAWFHRGNTVSYIDQPPIAAAPPLSINEVMSLPSSRLFQPRSFHKRYMNRPRGGLTNRWPLIDHDAQGNPVTQTESWESEIRLYGDNFGAGPGPQGQTIPPYFFYEQYFKVLFRARYTS